MIVGIVCNLYKIFVLPTLSNPKINVCNFFYPNKLSNSWLRTMPILFLFLLIILWPTLISNKYNIYYAYNNISLISHNRSSNTFVPLNPCINIQFRFLFFSILHNSFSCSCSHAFFSLWSSSHCFQNFSALQSFVLTFQW